MNTEIQKLKIDIEDVNRDIRILEARVAKSKADREVLEQRLREKLDAILDCVKKES